MIEKLRRRERAFLDSTDLKLSKKQLEAAIDVLRDMRSVVERDKD